jgi:hypothetical protein
MHFLGNERWETPQKDEKKIKKKDAPGPITLTAAQFHLIWTEAVGRDGYCKKLFQDIEKDLRQKGLIV